MFLFILPVTGLERVAEELMGRRSWASYQDLMVGHECRSELTPWHTVSERSGRSGSSSPADGPMSTGSPWYVPAPDSPDCLDQPLDLSAKPSSQTPQQMQPQPLMISQQPVKIPSPSKHIFKAKPRLSAVAAGRRSYTEEELQAALRDIQSGKLGTRRAAVQYGIPRSTLRNKVYKLSQERRDFAGGIESARDDDDVDDDRDMSEDERETEKVLMSPLTMVDVMRLTTDRRALEALPYLHQLLAHHRQLPELMRSIEEERLPKAMITARPGCSTSDKEHLSPTDQSGVILKVPSFKPAPKNNGSDTSSPAGPRSESNSPPAGPLPAKGLSMSLRDVITKYPPEQGPLAAAPPSQALDFARRGDQNIRNHNNNHLDEKKLSPSSKAASNSQSNSANSAGGKGTRPKRGKYRNYDRDSLVEAVRAVQRGEMSVHRAGSYYGVPHSTLEYKVKERHLMRPRKREPKPQQQQTQSTTPAAADDVAKRKEEIEKRVAATTRPQRFTPPLPIPPPANGLKMPPTLFDPALAAAAYHPSAAQFPFWPSPTFPLPLDYPRPELFAATQMMQRLQHGDDSSQSLGKTTREIAESLYDGSGENGSFLDGIIRSSLETGLPASKEASKALLEQLCRGSSLTEAEQKKECISPRSISPSPTTTSAASSTITTETRDLQDKSSAPSPDRPSSASRHSPDC
ncbi:hypothetical protein O3M35_012276 [Rhynocoris fuscipes]|uniref:HTH psq-type domain-containing protein n=1 Tax=Rhynocoris fuscipes TaxID=488301 RepID=A0AAW1CSL2_9HEMI